MRRTVSVLALASLASAAFAGDVQKVQVKELGEGRFELTVTLPDTTDPSKGQPALMPKVAELCGAKSPLWGKYKFKGIAPMAGTDAKASTSLVFVQEMQCGEAPAADAAVPAEAFAPATPPTADDEAMIRSRTLEFLAAKDRGEFDAALAMFSDSTGAMLTDENWRTPRAAFNASAGIPLQRQVVRVTWYDNPAGAEPGRYAAADYSARYDSAAFYCGYVAWRLQPDGGYRIVREEEGQMKPSEVRLVAPGDMAAARAQLGCRD